jgi:long-chain acyl-CoA synthetase
MNLAELAERDLVEHGEFERLWFEERSYTNRELLETSKRFATSLQGIGVGVNDKVVILLANCPEVLVGYAAVWRIGAVVIPVLHVLEAHELAFILKDSGAKAVVTSHDLVAKVEEAKNLGDTPAVRIVAVTEGKGEVTAPTLKYEELIDAPALEKIVPREKDDLAVVLYTSGTTGHPKGVMQSHNNLIANSQNSWNTAKTKDPSETSLLVLPLAHTFGLSVVVGGYQFGGRAVLMRRFHPVEALQLIQRFKIANMSGVPTMFMYMLMLPEQVKFDTSSMRIWIVGAAPMPTEQLKKFEQRYGGQMYVGYGLTEASPTVAVEREGEPRKPGSTGRPVEGVQVKIVDDDGKELPTGEVGEVCASGENITLGYLGRPEETAKAFRDGWLHTGDMGYLDEDGYLFIVERKKDLIIRGGLNIYPKDVEEVIYRHASVRECAVVGVPDLLMGEQVCACIVLKDGASATAEEIIEHCQQNLAKYKTPKYVEFLKELPKTTIGKIQKKELRKLAAAKYENAAPELVANAQ